MSSFHRLLNFGILQNWNLKIILHWMVGYDTWSVLFDICVGGFQVQSLIIEPDQTIISIKHAEMDFEMIETMNLFSKAELIIGGRTN